MLGGAHGAQNADFLGAFQNRNIRDDADHNGGHNQRNADKCDQHIGNSIDHVCEEGHHDTDKIRVADDIRLPSLLLGGLIVGIDKRLDGILCFKAGGIDIDTGGVIEIDGTKLLHDFIIGQFGDKLRHIVVVESKYLFVRECWQDAVKDQRHLLLLPAHVFQ